MNKNSVTYSDSRRLKVIVIAQVFWMTIVSVLGAWWVWLVLKQASRIAELERLTGATLGATQDQWNKTQRMLYWESATFFAILLISTGVLFWLYWRDSVRARALHAFFASVTHELRTPLTSIRLQAESIAEGSKNRLVDRLLEDTLRLESQVERTLELARVEGGGRLFRQAIQIKPWLERALRSWREAYNDRIEFNVHVEDLSVEADPTAIEVILKNIIENSMRHSKPSGKIIITIRSTVQGGRVILALQDNGTGFSGDVEKLGKLFEKGVSSPGAGVGLYLVKVLMKKMGGAAVFTAGPAGFKVSLSFLEAKPNA